MSTRRARTIGAGAIAAAVLALAILALRVMVLPGERSLVSLLPPDYDLYLAANLDALQANAAVRLLLADPPDLAASPGNDPRDENDTAELLRATGFRYQDHLHELAAARRGEDWAGAVRATVDRAKLEAYFDARGAAHSLLQGRTVFSFGTVRALRLAFLDERTAAFTVSSDATLLAGMLDRYDGSAVEQAAILPAERQALLEKPLWIFTRLDRWAGPGESAARETPSFGGFLFGREMLAGAGDLFLGVESGPLTLRLEAEILCRGPEPARRMAENLELLVSLLRPRAATSGGTEQGTQDFGPLWDAVKVSTEGSAVFLRWSATPQMLARLAGPR